MLESYKEAKVSIVDHYTQAEQFMEHMAAEYKERGGGPADWVWLVPPMSGSLVPTYHQEMLRFSILCFACTCRTYVGNHSQLIFRRFFFI